MAQEFEFTIAFDDFDVSLLPPDARVRGSAAFVSAMKNLVIEEFARHGGWARVSVDDNARLLGVSWGKGDRPYEPLDTAVARLQRGEYQAAITTLEILRFHDPANTAVLYNLGMALSDQGQLPAAIAHLRRAGQLDPTDANTQIALGVALARDGKLEEAIVCLQNGVLLDPANPWAYRNLGGCQARLGRNTEAEANLRRAAELNPDDPAAHAGLGQVLLELKRSDEADEHFLRAIELDPFGAIGESAKESRTRIAEANFRSTGIGGLRPDAVMYLAGALELFASMTPKQVQSVGMEIAVLGLKGLDTNDPAQKYRLKCLPGPFSGLNLMCLMYVAFKQIASDQDIGFDVTREYRVALEFVEARKSGGK